MPRQTWQDLRVGRDVSIETSLWWEPRASPKAFFCCLGKEIAHFLRLHSRAGNGWARDNLGSAIPGGWLALRSLKYKPGYL